MKFGAVPDTDAPRLGEAEHTPSAALEDAIRAAAEVGRAVERGEMPTPEQLNRLGVGIGVVKMGVETVGAAIGAPVNKSTWPLFMLAVALSVLAAIGATLGVLAFTRGPDEALAASIVARMDAGDRANERQDERIGSLEKGVEQLRYALGKTIEWFSQEQYESCLRDKAEAEALNYLARQIPRVRGDDMYQPLRVECEQNPILPTDLTDLQTHARRVDNDRK